MKIGIGIPEQLIGFDPVVLRDYAVAAEELGFDFLTCVDHVLGTEHARRDPPFAPGGIYTEESKFHEPLTLFAFLAGVTTRIELTSSVLVLPQRQTALVAKQAAEVALLSNYRLRLGVGSGWNYIEYESLGTDYRTRGRRLEEQVNVLRRLWSDPLLDFTGEFHRIDRASINPRLERPVPIWFGGFSQVQQDRCARIGDGMLWGRNSSLSRAGNEFIRRRAAEVGRDPDSIGFQAGVHPREGETYEQALAAWEAAGGTHATVSLVGAHAATGSTGRSLVDQLPRLREAVGNAIVTET
ncbi:MAG: LLM class F420-dependent oxidoreductase [Acidobacteria bacterium]|nr:LLM class F420-dependent oxidoreductase [Acidobacteriota bacterium]